MVLLLYDIKVKHKEYSSTKVPKLSERAKQTKIRQTKQANKQVTKKQAKRRAEQVCSKERVKPKN